MVDYENVRITVVRRTDPAKDWAGTGRYLSIRAYRGDQFGKALFMGPDIPIYGTLSDEEIERLSWLWLEAVTGGPILPLKKKDVA